MDKVYHNPKNPAAFGGILALQRETKQPHTKVKKFLNKDTTYRKFFQRKGKRTRARILAASIAHIFQCDLFELTKFSRQNQGHKYLLVVVDCFSRRVSARALRNKTGPVVADKLREIFVELREKNLLAPNALCGSDLGSEFISKDAQKVFNDFNISWFPLRAPKKASLCELQGRWLLDRIYKHMHHTGEKRWVDQLQDFVDAKNKRPLRSLGMRAPNDVNYENRDTVYTHLYKEKKYKEPKLKIGQKVNISLDRMPFFKSFRGYYGSKVYEIIRKVDYGNISRYALKDTDDGEEISGSYYYFELLPI